VVVSRELELVWPVHKTLQINAAPIMGGGSVAGCLMVAHDVTEIRKLEIIRTDFVANASHELKTPLTSIKGFVETLLEGALDDKEHAAHFLKIIQEHTDRLNNLINDLLDLSYLESKGLEIHKSPVQLKILVDNVLAGFNVPIKKRSIEAVNAISPEVAVSVDKAKIEQVFTNLIDNAVKFNKEGGSLTISAEKTSGTITLLVKDSGSGIPAKDLPRIFERFYRVDKARSREMGGTGLGLAIVKHIVELHGGTVGVESTEGLGSQFWFTLPLK
jgi:two-component system, OmpR family, phosphate regulon sensor histidine kinase PhoR